MQKAIADLHREVGRVESEIIETPAEKAAVEALKKELTTLGQAEDTIGGVPARYHQELAAKTPLQLAADVSKQKTATREERNVAGRIRDASKRIAALRKKYTAELRESGETPILRYLREGKPGQQRQVYWHPRTDPEVRDWLQGKDISVRRFFTTTAKPNALALDELADELKRRNILLEDAGDTAVLDALGAELERPHQWEALLRAKAAEEAAVMDEGEATGRPAMVEGYTVALERLEQAYAEAADAADRLRELRVEEMALSAMPHAQKAARQLEDSISRMEGIAERAHERKAIALQQRLSELREELSALERQLAEQGDLPELRRYAAMLRATKGLSQKRFGEIVAKYATPLPDGRQRRSTKGVEDRPTLLKIISALERARPKVIGGKTVITAKRERHIQQLRQNLEADGAMTPDDFVRILRELRIVQPRYVSARDFATEEQAVRLIDTMIAQAPVIEQREATHRALAANPQAQAIVRKIEGAAEQRRVKMAEKGKLAKTNAYIDFRYYLGNMDRDTGAAFLDSGMGMIRGKADAERAVTDDFDRITQAVGTAAYKKIAGDREGLERVNDLIASKLKRPGAPPRPEDATADEVKVAQAIEEVLHDQRNNVRWERFLRYRFKAVEIPDADARELNKATDLYESQGPEAARAYLDTLSWGVIKSGYEPESVVIPKIHAGPEPPMRYGVKGIEAREAVFQRQDRNILVRLHSYLFRRYQHEILMPKVRAFVSVWDANSDRFEKPDRVARELGAAISEIQGAAASDHPLARFIRRAYSHALLAKVLIDPSKSLRNVMQTAALYTDRSDLVHPGIRSAVTPADREYYRRYVSQLGGLRRDLFMEQERPFFWLRRWVDLARKIAPYRWSDEYPRRWCFAAKLARVDRALKEHPDNVRRMLDAAAIDDLDPRQVRAAVEMLARDGEEAFKHYVAHEVTNNVHFVYGRAERAPAEHGEMGRIVGNLLTFPRSHTQRVAKQLTMLWRGRPRTKWRAMKTLLSMIVGGWLVGEGYRRFWGQRRNPYNLLQVANWEAGGLMTGAVDIFSDLIWATERGLMGDRAAWNDVAKGITDLPDMFLPGYAELLNVAEGISGTTKLDLYGLKVARQKLLDKGYKPNDPGVQRTAIETWQKVLAGGSDLPLTDIATPEAVKLARKYGVDPREVDGTLRSGKVGQDDVRRYLRKRSALRRQAEKARREQGIREALRR